MPTNWGNKRGSDGKSSSEPSRQIRPNFSLAGKRPPEPWPTIRSGRLSAALSVSCERSKASISASGNRPVKSGLIDPCPLNTSATRRGARAGMPRMRSRAALSRCSVVRQRSSFRTGTPSFIAFRQIVPAPKNRGHRKAAGLDRRLALKPHQKRWRPSGRRLDRRCVHLVAGLGVAHRDFLADLEVGKFHALGRHVG